MASDRRQRIAAYAVLTDIRDRVLLVKASPEDSGRWFLPGGGVRFGEDPEAGLRREVEEETGQIVADLELTGVLSDVSQHKGTGLHSIRLIYRATLAEERPLCNEAPGGSTVEVRWVPLERVADLDTAPFVLLALEVDRPSRLHLGQD
ncbi:MAG: NUDIX domain-containing protein [Marmoricola sp.]